MAGTQPNCGNGGVSDAVTSELGDRQSSHPVKNPASILWQVFRGIARCCLPRFQGQPQHLKNTKYLTGQGVLVYTVHLGLFAGITVFIYQHVKLQPHVEGVQIFNVYSKTDR